MRDEHGQIFFVHSSPTKDAQGGRMRVTRQLEPQFAIQLLGVRDLFPDGFPEPQASESAAAQEQADTDTGPATVADWKEDALSSMDSDLRFFESWNVKRWRGLCTYGPRFRFGTSDIEQLESIFRRFRKELFETLESADAIDTQGSPRPSFLRLVANNTA
jgi:hypothetical protein